MKKKAHSAAALTATRRLDVERAIDMAKNDKTTPWLKPTRANKEAPETKKQS
jgi:hypothetical protein